MPDESSVVLSMKNGGGRSVSYPFITLEQAVQRAKVLWDNEGKNLGFMSAAVKHWNYGEKSSGGKQTVAALKAFGLIEDVGSGDGRQIRLTPRALDILLEPDEPKRKKALKDAATSPKIYSELLQRWPANALPSDLTIEAYLLRERDFNRNTVKGFIKDFRANIAYSGLAESANIPQQVVPITEGKPEKNEQPLALKVGSWVEWEAGGDLQFETPRRVTGFSENKDFVFVEDSLTGLPINEVTVILEPESAATPPAGSSPPVKPSPIGSRQDTFTLNEGTVVLQLPAKLSSDSYEDFESWIHLQLKKIKRSVAN
jgi:hypothetical protein